MARRRQVFSRFTPRQEETLEVIGKEQGIFKADGSGEVNVSEVIRRLCAKADSRMAQTNEED